MTDEEHAAGINAAWRNSAIEAGQLLLAAKADLPAYSFQWLVKRLTHFPEHIARQLMKIAEHPLISTIAGMPRSEPALSELSTWTTDELRAAIGEDLLKPEMTRAEVRNVLTIVRQLLGERRC